MALATFFKASNFAMNALATVTAVSVIGFSGYMVYDNVATQNKAYGYDLLQYKPSMEEATISMQDLYDLNPDVAGWLTIDDTHIDYPIVHSDDDLYYVNRDVYGQASITGSIYLQAKNSQDFTDSYNLLYGHHLDGGAMFGDLSEFRNSDFFNKHGTGTLITMTKAYNIDIIACCNTNAYNEAVYNRTVLDAADYTEFLKSDGIQILNTNSRNSKKAVKYLVLSTCFGASTDGRTIVVCKLTEIPKPVDPPKDDPTPKIIKTGEVYTLGWSLLSAVSVILTAFTIVPYIRKLKTKKVALFAGFAVSLIATVASVSYFFHVESFNGPMMLTDQYTHLFILLFGAAVITEELITRFKDKKIIKEETIDEQFEAQDC